MATVFYQTVFQLGMSVLCGILKKKLADHINTKYVAENMRKSLRYIFCAGVSLVGINCCRRWPLSITVALTMLLG